MVGETAATLEDIAADLAAHSDVFIVIGGLSGGRELLKDPQEFDRGYLMAVHRCFRKLFVRRRNRFFQRWR